MGIFALFLFFSQVDFAVIRLLADLLVTGYSTVWFIQGKRVVPTNQYQLDTELQLIPRDNHQSDYDDEEFLEESGNAADIILKILRQDDGDGGDKPPLVRKFAIVDIDEEINDDEHDNNHKKAEFVPSSDCMDSDEEMLPLSISKVQEKSRRKIHPRLPSQTTVSQRNEDTRP